MRLREWREQNRPKPHLDDKIMVSWNGLMVRSGFTHLDRTNARADACTI
jgi:uncharacterized protein YyaL (SSP411 family)